MHHEMSKDMQNCIQNALDCSNICLQTVNHCLGLGGEHAEVSHIRLLLDCAEICQTSANFMNRHSDHHADTCRICADVCHACAESCRALGDEDMSRCADACDRCAASCEAMASSGRRATEAETAAPLA